VVWKWRNEEEGCLGGNVTRRLVVTTPFNGFGASGGERGPGVAIAVWLAEVLPVLLKAKGLCTELIFGFLSGHNEGSLGLKSFLSQLQKEGLGPQQVTAYITLGANIGIHYSFSEEEHTGRKRRDGANYEGIGHGESMLNPRAVPSLYNALMQVTREEVFLNITKVTNATLAGTGDNRYIYAAGYEMASWQGWFFPRFHMETDTGTSVSEARLGALAGGALGMLGQLASGGRAAAPAAA